MLGGGSLEEVARRELDGTAQTFGYDAAQRLVSDESGGYTLDALGRRIIVRASATGPWVYNANHQLLNHGEGHQAVTREYDANGHTRRIAESGAEKRLQYDVAERLTAVTDGQDTPIGTYAYDPFGRRLKKTTASKTIYFQHGEEGLLAE